MVLRDGMLPMPFPVVLGHEGSGIVVKVGKAVTGVSQGDHVVLSFDSCGHCPSCDVDAPAYCHSWFPLNFGGGRSDGTTALRGTHGEAIHSHIFGQSSFATNALVHERNLVNVDKDLPLEPLAPLVAASRPEQALSSMSSGQAWIARLRSLAQARSVPRL